MQRPEPGWYPDPERPGQVRYYDGTDWTTHVRDVAPTTATTEGLPAADPPEAESTGAAGADAASRPTRAAADPDADAGTGSPRTGQDRGMVLVVSIVLMVLVLGGSFFFGGFLGGDEGDDTAELEVVGEPEDDAAQLGLSGDDADADGAPADAADDDPAEAAEDEPAADDPAQGEGGGSLEGPQDPVASGAEDVDPYEIVIDVDATYLATIRTSEGDIVVELDAAGAPVTTNNLVRLARAGYYDGVVFHRVIEGFVIQGGDPTGTGAGGPGYRFDDELGPAEELVETEGGYPRGTLAMANAGPDTNGSQFFVVHGELVELPPAYTVFGRVVDGMDVVDAIATSATTGADRPVDDVTIATIEIDGP